MAIIITLIVAAFWFLPVYSMYWKGGREEWGWLYIPIVGLSFAWGSVIANLYF